MIIAAFVYILVLLGLANLVVRKPKGYGAAGIVSLFGLLASIFACGGALFLPPLVITALLLLLGTIVCAGRQSKVAHSRIFTLCAEPSVCSADLAFRHHTSNICTNSASNTRWSLSHRGWLTRSSTNSRSQGRLWRRKPCSLRRLKGVPRRTRGRGTSNKFAMESAEFGLRENPCHHGRAIHRGARVRHRSDVARLRLLAGKHRKPAASLTPPPRRIVSHDAVRPVAHEQPTI